MNTVEKKLENGRIELITRVEPDEVKEWIQAWCDKNTEYSGALKDFDSCDLADERNQTQAKAALLAYGDFAVMDSRTPSPLTKPVLVAKTDVAQGEHFEFSIVYMPFPQMDLTSYDPVEVKMMPLKVDDEEVENRLSELLKELPSTQAKAVGSVIEEGDTVEIKMDATSYGKPYDALTASLREYRLGDGFMPKAFEDMLLGMKVDEEASVDLKVPKGQDVESENEEDYRDVTVHVKVLRILCDDIETLRDEDVSLLFPGIKTVEQLKTAVRQLIIDEKEQMRNDYKLSRILYTLSRRVDGSLSDDIYEAQYEASMKDLEQQLKENNMTKEEFFEMQKTDESQFRLSVMMDIRGQLTQSIALDAIARHAQLTPTEDDRNAFFTMVTQLEGDEVARQMQETTYAAAIDESIKRMMAQEWALAQCVEVDASK